jgi:hypothetical protein
MADTTYAATQAMEETQRRAAADREAALKAIQDAMSGGGGATYANLVNKLAESPETISPEMESKMYEQARVPVEAQAQSALRSIQENYYGRGIPGGASRSAAEQVQIGKGGTLGNLKFNIALQRAQTGKTDLQNAIGAAGGLANYQMGGAQNLANIYSNTIAAVPSVLPTAETFGGKKITNTGGTYIDWSSAAKGAEQAYKKALEEYQKNLVGGG